MAGPELPKNYRDPYVKTGFLQFLFSQRVIDQASRDALQQTSSWQEGVSILALLEHPALTEQALYPMLSKFTKLDLVDLNNYTKSNKLPHGLKSFMVRKFGVVPVSFERGSLTVAVAAPISDAVKQAIQERSNAKNVTIVLAQLHQMEAVWDEEDGVEPGNPEITGVTPSPTAAAPAHRAEPSRASNEQRELSNRLELTLREINNRGVQKDDLQVSELFEVLLSYAIAYRSSDLHIEPRENHVAIRIRVDGSLKEVGTIPNAYKDGMVSRLKVLSSLDITEKYKPQDGKLEFNYQGQKVEVRVSFFRVLHGEKVALRILDQRSSEFDLAKLGMEQEQLEIANSILTNPYGIILVTGPTGSGKSTTLYTMLDRLNIGEVNITTIEDPVEREIDRINQCNVLKSRGMDFHNSLRAILRQDPDVIMLGEIRDTETAEIAFQAALTGHLVFATVHTNDALSTLDRVLNLGIDRAVIALGLVGIIAQRLLGKNCPECLAPFEPDRKVLELLGLEKLRGVTFARGQGCGRCGYRGMSGRTAIFEILENSPQIQDDLQSGKSIREMYATARKLGWHPLRFAGIRKLLAHETTVEEVLAVTSGRV